MKANKTKLMMAGVAGAVITFGAIGTAIAQEQPAANSASGSTMETGVTVTNSAAPTELATPVAVPAIKGPAPLPVEEQGLPG